MQRETFITEICANDAEDLDKMWSFLERSHHCSVLLFVCRNPLWGYGPNILFLKMVRLQPYTDLKLVFLYKSLSFMSVISLLELGYLNTR